MLVVKNLPINSGDVRASDLIPKLGRFPEGGHVNTLHTLGCGPEGHIESDMAEVTSHAIHTHISLLSQNKTLLFLKINHSSHLFNLSYI